MNAPPLPESIDAADTLLKAGRRPRQIHEDHEPTAVMEVQAFARGIGRDEHPRVTLRERPNGRGSLGRCLSAVQDLDAPEFPDRHRERTEPPADLILSNGRIVTVDGQFSIAQAVAIRGQRIVAVGADRDVERRSGPETRRIDLRGRTVVPGVIDNHLHLLRAGTTTAAVYCTVFPQSVEAFFEQSDRLNTRMIAGKVLMDRNAPEPLRDTAKRGYEESRELIKRWHGHGRQLYCVTPRFAPTSTPVRPIGRPRIRFRKQAAKFITLSKRLLSFAMEKSSGILIRLTFGSGPEWRWVYREQCSAGCRRCRLRSVASSGSAIAIRSKPLMR